MKILLTGGGTGGHITPLLAVGQALKQLDPTAELICVTERGSKFAALTRESNLFESQHYIYAGKFRRYHGESWFKRLFDVRTNLFNLRDVFLVFIGIFQAIWLLGRLRPNVIFIKGGFVGVPMGLAAALWHIPFLTHDSDTLPGLANRLVGRWASLHATGLPAKFYTYPVAKVNHVGVLVGQNYQPITPSLQADYRRRLGLPARGQVLTVTGGSLGAQRLNKAVANITPTLLERYPDLHIIHQVGKGNLATHSDFSSPRLHVYEFLSDMHIYTGAADVVVTRAGTTTVAELGVQARPIIVVPNPFLTGGHQIKNAQYWATEKAALVVNETNIKTSQGRALQEAVEQLLDQPAQAQVLGQRLQAITITDAADRLVQLLLKLAKTKGGSRAAKT